MHTDENKKFDVRNIDRNFKEGLITEKDYQVYLSRLPDVSEKVFNVDEESTEESEELKRETTPFKKRLEKKKRKGSK